MFRFEPSAGDRVIELIQPYLTLNKALADEKDVGKPFRYKFANNGEGVSRADLTLLDMLCDELAENKHDKIPLTQKLVLIDALTLKSNHIDQQTKNSPNPLLEKSVKEAIVLKLLTAAFQMIKNMQLDIEALSRMPRILSTIAQTSHYLGKAMRYNPEFTQAQRMPYLNSALEIANMLNGKPADTEQDIHGYSARISTYEMPLIYAYRDSGLYDAAIALSQRQINEARTGTDAFPLVQALVQTSLIYTQKGDYELGLANANEAVMITQAKFNKHVLYFNAQEALMKAYIGLGQTDKANDVAQHVLDRYQADANCGAKADHVAEANKVKNRLTI